MAGNFTIQLKDLKFHAAHGLYEEEKKAGTNFLVDVDVESASEEQAITSIHDTIDYVKLYDIVKAAMAKPTPLLETVCMQIAEDIHRDFPLSKQISIRITKLSPPINNFTGTVAVRYNKAFA